MNSKKWVALVTLIVCAIFLSFALFGNEIDVFFKPTMGIIASVGVLIAIKPYSDNDQNEPKE